MDLILDLLLADFMGLTDHTNSTCIVDGYMSMFYNLQ